MADPLEIQRNVCTLRSAYRNLYPKRLEDNAMHKPNTKNGSDSKLILLFFQATN